MTGPEDRAFGLKMWRPCDENDVCEGNAVTPDADSVASKGMPPDRSARGASPGTPTIDTTPGCFV